MRKLQSIKLTRGQIIAQYSNGVQSMQPINGGKVKYAPILPGDSPRGNITRNGPCPCGSGRKFKKCCRGKS